MNAQSEIHPIYIQMTSLVKHIHFYEFCSLALYIDPDYQGMARPRLNKDPYPPLAKGMIFDI